MPFGVVSGVGPVMGVLDGGGDRRRGMGSFGVNLERPVVINLDFATRLFPNYFGQDLLSLLMTSIGPTADKKLCRCSAYNFIFDFDRNYASIFVLTF